MANTGMIKPTRDKALLIGGALCAAALSFGAGVLSITPPLSMMFAWEGLYIATSYVAFAAWLILAATAIRRYRWLGAVSLLGAPFAAIAPLGLSLVSYMCSIPPYGCI